ncbi:hypothetical protein D3C80_1077680 [compost metagenome]
MAANPTGTLSVFQTAAGSEISMICTERFGTTRMVVTSMKMASHCTNTIGLRCLINVSTTASTAKVPAMRISVLKVFEPMRVTTASSAVFHIPPP